MKIGDKVWIFDGNHRVYPKDGGIGRSPIYSEYFLQYPIEAETSRSWIVRGQKYPKADTRGLYTDQEKEDMIWANDVRYKIVREVERCSGSMLKQINNLLKVV